MGWERGVNNFRGCPELVSTCEERCEGGGGVSSVRASEGIQNEPLHLVQSDSFRSVCQGCGTTRACLP